MSESQSGFSAELIDYLEGRISFEEFDRLREEREAKQAFASMLGETAEQCSTEEDENEEEGNSYVDDEDDEDYQVDEEDEDDKDRGDEEDEESPDAGDVFALEMELNRENKKMMKERRHRSKLPRALRGLMGEANIRYARGEKEDAILMCMEIIRQAPLAYEPFSTLAMIYEDEEDVEKALQFGLIAAHLNPSDCEEWAKLAEMSLEQGNVRQAIVCYGKAIKHDSTNVRYLWERSSLYMQLGEHKQCMDGYRRILSLLPSEDGHHFMQLSRDMAKSYYESNDLPSALGVIEEALSRHSDLLTDEVINMAAELYIANHQHGKALQVVCVLVDFCGIVLVRAKHPQTDPPLEKEKEGEQQTEGTLEKKNEETTEAEEVTAEEGHVSLPPPVGEVRDVHVPDSVPMDIRVKLIICLIHQHVYSPLDMMLTGLMEQSPEDFGDLYLDVAEAFLDEGCYTSALPLLSALVCSEKYNLAVVWLRHAECLKALGHMEVAVRSYGRVVELAPQHLEARLSLSTLEQQLGHPQRALEALCSMYDAETLAHDASAAQQELKLLLHRSTLLKTQGRLDDYLDSMLTMLAMLLKVAMTRAKVCVRSVIVSGVKHLRLVKVKDHVSDIDDQEAAYQDISGKTSVLSREDWWQLVVQSMCTLCEVRRFKEAELLVDSSLEFYSFYDVIPKRKELEFFGLSAAFLDHNYRKAYDYIRLMLIDTVERPQLWNVFNQVTFKSQDVRHHRFCLRLMLKNPDNHALNVLCGHNALVSGSFKHALGQYVQAFRSHPKQPLYSLCVGLTFFHMASQKFVAKRHPLLLQGFSFLWRYVDLRGPCQESMYNLGRALHQMGLTHLAIHYYHKALSMEPPKLEGMVDDQVDLRREISFNLALIYQSSGNINMARQLINTYCIV
ncbi:general transcription factor 3C polypeptide 3 [Aplochiton taeniatus]